MVELAATCIVFYYLVVPAALLVFFLLAWVLYHTTLDMVIIWGLCIGLVLNACIKYY